MAPSFKELFVNHFNNTKHVRSDAQLEREKWIIPGVVPFSRYALMPAAVAIQLCVGTLYALSGYYLHIEAAVLGLNGGIDRSQASIAFYIAVAIFGSSAAVLGPWLERNGPTRGTLLGAVLFFAGNLLSALAVYTKQMWLFWVGYGIVGGIGLGIGYISPVSPLQKWFPEMRGVASGLAVCGFGGGSIIAPFAQNALIGPNSYKTGEINFGVPLTFVILGSIYFVVMVIAAFILRMPPPGYQIKGITIHTIKGAENLNLSSEAVPSTSSSVEETKIEQSDEKTEKEGYAAVAQEDGKALAEEDGKPSETVVVLEPSKVPDVKDMFTMDLLPSLTSTEFRMMYAMLFCAQISGLLVISKIQTIAANQLGKDSATASVYNSALGAMNLAGRLILPLTSDFIGRKPLFIISTFVQAILVGFLPTALHARSTEGTLTCLLIIGFFYGSGFGIIPAFLADQFGSKNVGATHGVILTAWSLAGVAGGLIFNAIVSMESSRLTVTKITSNLIYVYDVNLIWVLVIVCIGFVITCFVPVNLRDRRLPKVPGEQIRFRLPNRRLARLINWKIVIVSKADEDAEWDAFLTSVRTLAPSNGTS